MKLSDLNLNRFLYRDNLQNLETKDAAFNSSNVIEEDVPGIPSGGAAQDINTSNVFINGSQLEPGSYILDVSNWGWGQTCAFTSASATQVNWGAGTFTSASGDAYSISAGNTGTMSAKTYIYLDLNVSETAYQRTTTSSDAVGVGKVLIAVAENGAVSATYNINQANQIVGDNILANSINASKIVAGSITSTQISSSYIYAGTINANQITAGLLTGFTIQTATTGLRIKMSSSPTNKIEFLYNDTVEGVLEIVQSSDEYRLKLGGDAGGYFEITSSLGASELYGISMPFFEGSGKASAGQVYMLGSPNYPTQAGLDWSGGGVATFRFDLGSSMARFKLPVGTNLY